MVNVEVEIRPLRRPLVATKGMVVVVPFLLRLTNHDDKHDIRVRNAVAEVRTRHWRLPLAVVKGLSNSNQEIDEILAPLVSSDWMLVHVAMPLTSQTFFGVIHPENTKVHLRMERVGGLLKEAKCIISTSQWWTCIVMPAIEAGGEDNDNNRATN